MTSALKNPRWRAIPERHQLKLLDEYRDINAQDDWWKCVENDLRIDLEGKGFDMHKMYFSGFWSQGDGASFTGRVDDWPKFLKFVGVTDERLINIVSGAYQFDKWTFIVKLIDSHYSHEGCVGASTEFHTGNGIDEDDDPLRHASYQILLDELEANWYERLCELETEWLEALHDLMRKCYRDLQEEYEYLTSDEQVVEYLLEHLDSDELLDPDAEEEEESPEEAWSGFIAEATL